MYEKEQKNSYYKQIKKGDEFMKEKLVYEVSDIMYFLNISRSSAYRFIQEVYKNKEPFKVFKIGNNYRIPKKSFEKWLGM